MLQARRGKAKPSLSLTPGMCHLNSLRGARHALALACTIAPGGARMHPDCSGLTRCADSSSVRSVSLRPRPAHELAHELVRELPARPSRSEAPPPDLSRERPAESVFTDTRRVAQTPPLDDERRCLGEALGLDPDLLARPGVDGDDLVERGFLGEVRLMGSHRLLDHLWDAKKVE